MRHKVAGGMLLALALLVGPVFAGVAWADSIGPSCGSCFGGIYTLQYIGPDDGSVTIIYTADLTGTIVDDTTTLTDIDAIAFKVVSGGKGNQITSGSLNLFTVDGVASAVWGTDFRVAGLDAGGCDADNPPGDWVCSQAAGGIDNGPATGHVYQWFFTINYTGSLFTGLNQASIKADFSPGKGHLLSENITLQLVPEPATLMLLGTGFAGLGLARRLITRRRR